MQERLVSIEPGFLSEYDKLPQAIKKKLKKQIEHLRGNPEHPSLQIHKIEGSDFMEFYVDKCYRCVFKKEGNVYRLYFVGTHELIDKF